jgi:hypothetical protein
MIILNLPVLTVLAAAFATAPEVCAVPAEVKCPETRRAERTPPAREGLEIKEPAEGKYASVNGLKMYYEIHGTGRPQVLLHGAFGQAAQLPAGNKP